MQNLLIHRRGPKSFPKAKCHGCGKCFQPEDAREFEEKRLFWRVRGSGRRDRPHRWHFGTALKRRLGKK